MPTPRGGHRSCLRAPANPTCTGDFALLVNTTEYVGTRMARTLKVEAKCGVGAANRPSGPPCPIPDPVLAATTIFGFPLVVAALRRFSRHSPNSRSVQYDFHRGEAPEQEISTTYPSGSRLAALNTRNVRCRSGGKGQLLKSMGITGPAGRKAPESTLLSHSNLGRRRTALGQSETNITTEPWSAVEWIADADLTRASFYWDSVPHREIRPVHAEFAAEQFHARIAPNNAMTLSRIDWL